jgi:MFS family permease
MVALVAGMTIMTLAYIGFSFTETVTMLFSMYTAIGIGVGITTPARLAFFSMHLDKNKESTEWGIRDATVFGGMAMSAALGGFIAERYGFSVLFIISAIVNILALIPHMLYVKRVNNGRLFR